MGGTCRLRLNRVMLGGGCVSKEAGWQVDERQCGSRKGGAAWALPSMCFLQWVPL